MREPPSIVVTGRGEASAAPDRAVVRLGATAQAEQAQTAQDQVNAIVARAIDALKRAGIAERDIQTRDLSLHPVYSEAGHIPLDQRGRGPREPRITGYRASNTVEVRVNEVGKVGAVIDAGVTAGANELQGVTFELKEDATARTEALKRAIEKARADAQTIADALGVTLGPIDEALAGGRNEIFPQQRFAGMAMEAMPASGTPVQPGEIDVGATVTLRYRIAGGDRSPATQPARP
ncbi:MAG TPA: SIMPL domain-containing protein [Tepidisphaeraceae bacterium]|nr:SIMPL domain-containing protein [Tepidisphaeraceae bacterium]